MNDPMFIEIAEALGNRMRSLNTDLNQQLEAGFRWLLTRSPESDEMALLREFHTRHNNWTATARALLSLDEAITKN